MRTICSRLCIQLTTSPSVYTPASPFPANVTHLLTASTPPRAMNIRFSVSFYKFPCALLFLAM